jgi:hypothetical protein
MYSLNELSMDYDVLLEGTNHVGEISGMLYNVIHHHLVTKQVKGPLIWNTVQSLYNELIETAEDTRYIERFVISKNSIEYSSKLINFANSL